MKVVVTLSEKVPFVTGSLKIWSKGNHLRNEWLKNIDVDWCSGKKIFSR